MPRIDASNADPVDLCQPCWVTEDEARALYGNRGDGPDGRGDCFEYNTEHPSYDWDEYTCDDCGKPLTERDN